MSDNPRKDYSAYRIKKSRGSLDAARILAHHEHWSASMNRLYYACFYIVSVLFYVKSIHTKTHNGIRTQFNIQKDGCGKT